MTVEKMKELYGCSVQGLIDDVFKSYKGENEMDYLNKSIAYILKYGMDVRTPSCSLQELIYTVKNQMGKMVAEKQLANNPKDLTNMQSKEYDLALKYFFTDPVGFIKTKLEDEEFYNSIKPSEDGLKSFEYKGYIRNLDKNRNKFLSLFRNEDLQKRDFKAMYTAFENQKILTYDVITSLENKLPDHNIDRSLFRQKPKAWERRFRTTSKQYKNFKKTFNEYRDRSKAKYGDNKALEDAAMQYLRHKFPKMADGELPTMEQIEALKGAGKERAMFCLRVVEACKETRTLKPQMNEMVKAVKALNLGEPLAEDLKANAVYKEHKIEKSEAKVEIKTEAKTETKAKTKARAPEVKPKKGALKQRGERRNTRSIKLNLGDGPVPERTKTTGGPKNVKWHPKKEEKEVKETKPAEEKKETKPVEEKKEVKQAVDTQKFQADLKDKVADEALVTNKIEATEVATEASVEMTNVEAK